MRLCMCVWPTVVPVPEVVCVADGVDGEVVDDTAGGHIRVSLRVNVGVTFPRLPGSELCTITQRHTHSNQHFFYTKKCFLFVCAFESKSTWGPGDSVSMGWGGVGTGRPAITHRAHWLAGRTQGRWARRQEVIEGRVLQTQPRRHSTWGTNTHIHENTITKSQPKQEQ